MAVSLAIVVIPGARKLSGSTSTCGKNIAVQSNIAPQILLILTSVFAGELLANAREDQKHEQSPKHSAWSEAYERIRSGLLLSFELRQRELASICVQGEGFRFDWRCTCGTVQSLFYPPTGMPPNK